MQASTGRTDRLTAATVLMAAAAVATGLGFLSGSAGAADLQRGQLLYETQCVTCHDSVLHLRNERQAHSFADVQERVRQWAKFQNSGWGEEEIDDVADYLNAIFYRYPCPDSICSFTPAKEGLDGRNQRS